MLKSPAKFTHRQNPTSCNNDCYTVDDNRMLDSLGVSFTDYLQKLLTIEFDNEEQISYFSRNHFSFTDDLLEVIGLFSSLQTKLPRTFVIN